MSAPTRHTFALSPREKDVLHELLKDAPTDERIADRLGIGLNTVKTYMKAVLRKADVPSRTALVLGIARGTLVPTTVWQDWRTGEWYETTITVEL